MSALDDILDAVWDFDYPAVSCSQIQKARDELKDLRTRAGINQNPLMSSREYAERLAVVTQGQIREAEDDERRKP